MQKVGLLVLTVWFLVSCAFGQINARQDLVFTSKEAVVLLPPIVVAKGIPTQVQWSDDGKWLFIESVESRFDANSIVNSIIAGGSSDSDATSETILSIFGLDKRTQVVVARYPTNRRLLNQVSWLPGSRFVAFTLIDIEADKSESATSSEAAFLASPGTGQSYQVLKVSDKERVEFFTDQRSGSAVATVTTSDDSGGTSTRAYWIGTSGKLGNPVQLKTGFEGIFWDNKGQGPYSAFLVPKTERTRASLAYFAINFQTGALSEVAEPDWSHREEEVSEFHFENGASIAQLKIARANKRSLWLESNFESEYKHALVALDGTDSKASPTGEAVFYQSQGIGIVRPLAKVPKDVAIKAIQAAVVREAKQVGLAMQMYAADYDDEMPLNDAEWKDSVDPYLKDRLMMEGFNYTYQGGNLGKLSDPSKTEIGYKDGPGGKAVVYADGSVKWIPNNGPVTFFTERRVQIRGTRTVSLCIV